MVFADLLLVRLSESLAVVIDLRPWTCGFNEPPPILPLVICCLPNQLWAHCFLGCIVVESTNMLNPLVLADRHRPALVVLVFCFRDNAPDSVCVFS
jgi:hypothetical protein